MANTPNVAAPLWGAAQATPWLTQNLANRIFDAFSVSTIVEEMDLTAPPVSCNDGARYLVHGTATGLWTGHDGQLAVAMGANASNGWDFANVALEGMVIRNRADSRNYRYTSGIWVAFADTISRFQDLLDVTISGLADGDLFAWDASNGLLFPQTIANLVAPILASYILATLDADTGLSANSDSHVPTQKAIVAYVTAAVAGISGATLDTDGTLAANSDSRIPSQKAVRTFVLASLAGFLDLKGGQDCSANPNYPAAVKGDYYFVTVAGRIGGGAGAVVAAGDIYFATADNAGGTQAGVGGSWDIVRTAASIVTGVSRLQDLTDVDLTGLADGNILKYDASNGLFYFAQDLGNPFASAGDVQAGQETGKSVTPKVLADSQAPQTLVDGATINWDMSIGYNAKVTLGGSRTLATPTNPRVGQTYSLAIIQDGTGSRLMTWPAGFDWGTTGAPTLTVTASKVDQIMLFCQDAATPKFRAYLAGKGFAS
jgi:hypothetical protein